MIFLKNIHPVMVILLLLFCNNEGFGGGYSILIRYQVSYVATYLRMCVCLFCVCLSVCPSVCPSVCQDKWTLQIGRKQETIIIFLTNIMLALIVPVTCFIFHWNHAYIYLLTYVWKLLRSVLCISSFLNIFYKFFL